MSNPAIQFPKPHSITVEEYLRMGETGILEPEARIELIEGKLFDMPPIGPPHSSRVNRIIRLFSQAVGDAAIVSARNPVVLGHFSALNPTWPCCATARQVGSEVAVLSWRGVEREQTNQQRRARIGRVRSQRPKRTEDRKSSGGRKQLGAQ